VTNRPKKPVTNAEQAARERGKGIDDDEGAAEHADLVVVDVKFVFQHGANRGDDEAIEIVKGVDDEHEREDPLRVRNEALAKKGWEDAGSLRRFAGSDGLVVREAFT
jgi:hypothetical protein